MTIKVAELFAGIGGFKVGIDRVYPGAEYVFVSEWDKFAAKAYETIHHIVPKGDITRIKETTIADHDLLVGGFPCQAFSIAGERKGFEDTRGTLFFDMARIAKEKQPKVVLAENVKGLVSHDKGQTLDIMVETLNEIGYTVDFEVLNSKFYGVPQNRERIFIVAVRNDLIEHEDWTVKGATVIPKGKRRIMSYGKVRSFNFNWPQLDRVTSVLNDILETDVDEKYYLDDDKVEALLAELKIKNGLAIREATKRGYAIASPGDAVNFQFPNSTTRRGRVGKQIANTLEAAGVNQGVVVETPRDPHMVGMLNMKGNESIRREYSPSAPGPTITSMGGGHREPKVVVHTDSDLRIRKLTPLECWRLQGFTDEQHGAVETAGISNSQRYKMAGNAVTTNVIEAIVQSIKKGGYLD